MNNNVQPLDYYTNIPDSESDIVGILRLPLVFFSFSSSLLPSSAMISRPSGAVLNPRFLSFGALLFPDCPLLLLVLGLDAKTYHRQNQNDK